MNSPQAVYLLDRGNHPPAGGMMNVLAVGGLFCILVGSLLCVLIVVGMVYGVSAGVAVLLR